MTYHEHHFRNLARARDHLTATIASLESAVGQMVGDDWLDATVVLNELTQNIGPRLARLRSAASDRFDEHARLEDFDRMRAGEIPFPDERVPTVIASTDVMKFFDAVPSVRRLNAPNAKKGAKLIALHGGVDAAMKAYEPDSPEWDHVQAYRYVSGTRPKGWIPPIVAGESDDSDESSEMA